MSRYLPTIGIIIIIVGCYLGIRYVSTVIHYACANPAEDCPPPFALMAELGFVITGGEFVPLWTREQY